MLRTPGVRKAIDDQAWHQPIVEFTFPLNTPVLGGLCAQAPALVASHYFRFGPLLEPTTLSVAERLLPSGGRFLDVGANIGLFSMMALRRLGPSGSVVAVEPNMRLAQVLSANLERHRSPGAALSIVQAAAGAERGAVDLWVAPNSLVGGVIPSPYYDGAGQRVSTEVFPVDELGLSELDLVKIDVEGYEPEVLSGLAHTIRCNPGVCLVIELNPACLVAAGHSVDDLLAHPVLENHRMWVIDDTSTLDAPTPPIVPLANIRDRIEKLDIGDRWFRNLVAVPVDRAEWFEREASSFWP